MNKVVLVGRLTRDPEVRYSQGGQCNCSCKIYSSSRPQISKEMENRLQILFRVLCSDVLLSLQRNISVRV